MSKLSQEQIAIHNTIVEAMIKKIEKVNKTITVLVTHDMPGKIDKVKIKCGEIDRLADIHFRDYGYIQIKNHHSGRYTEFDYTNVEFIENHNLVQKILVKIKRIAKEIAKQREERDAALKIAIEKSQAIRDQLLAFGMPSESVSTSSYYSCAEVNYKGHEISIWKDDTKLLIPMKHLKAVLDIISE